MAKVGKGRGKTMRNEKEKRVNVWRAPVGFKSKSKMDPLSPFLSIVYSQITRRSAVGAGFPLEKAQAER